MRQLVRQFRLRLRMEDGPLLQLKRSRSDAEAVIDRHLESGRKLLDEAHSVGSEDEYNAWDKDRQRWVNLTAEGLQTIYTNSEPAQEFRAAASPMVVVGGAGVAQEFEWAKRDVDGANNVLISLRERLVYIEAPGDSAVDQGASADGDVPEGEGQIFVVHGHAVDVKERVSRLLEKTGEHPVVILHEQPDAGRTIIEKFEDYAGRSDHAVVLLTADDVGGEASGEESAATVKHPRARQNVVFELGFFVGRLGRARVAVLYEEGVELPSDFSGVLYIPLDDDSWRFKLLKELRNAGLDFDLNEIPA